MPAWRTWFVYLNDSDLQMNEAGRLLIRRVCSGLTPI